MIIIIARVEIWDESPAPRKLQPGARVPALPADVRIRNSFSTISINSTTSD